MTEEKRIFVRKASGLRRVLGPFETMFFNVYFSAGLGFTTAYFIVWSLALTGGGVITFVLGILICTVFLIIQNLVWTFFSISMPRTGGDYIYTSRAMHPAIGFMANWTWAFWLTWWLNWGAYCIAYIGGTALLSNIAFVTGNPTVMAMAEAAATPEWSFWIGTVAIILVWLLCSSSIKAVATVQNILTAIALLALIIALGVLGFSSPQYFVDTFNQYLVSYTNNPNTYSAVIDVAKSLGFDPAPHFNWWAVAVTAAYCSWTMYWTWGTAYFSGEIKDVKRTQLIAMSVSPIFIAVGTIVLGLLLFSVCGYEFLASISWLYLVNPDGWAQALGGFLMPPYFYFFVITLTRNIILQIIMGVGFTVFGCWYLVGNTIVAARCVFAWSFDQLFPSKLSEIGVRLKGPWLTTAGICILGWISLYLYAFYPAVTIVGGILGIYQQSYILMLAGILFPYIRKDFFERSPVSYRVAGIPLISILSLIAFAFNTWLWYVFMTEPILGVVFSPITLGVLFGSMILGLIIFYVARWYRKRQRIDVDLAFKELPPE